MKEKIICEDHVHISDIEGSTIENLEIFEDLSKFFKAFGAPSRLRVMMALFHESLCVYDISNLTGLEQSAVSHILKYLKEMHLVKSERKGKSMFYSLDDDHVEQIINMAAQHIKHLKEEKGV